MRTIPHWIRSSFVGRIALLALTLGALCVAAPDQRPAEAAFHLANINEIMSGAGGNPLVQYVEIRTNATGQGVVNGTKLTVFQGAGHTVIASISSNLSPTTPQNRWIMASPSAGEWLSASGISTDFVITGTLPATNAMVCWGFPSNTANPNEYVDCLAYGGYSGATPPPSPTDMPTPLNAGDGKRSLTRIATTNNDLNDFAFACPTPENWQLATGSFGPCGGADTDGDQLDDDWEALYPSCVTVGVSDAAADVDTPTPDGLTNFQEMNGETDPCDTNTDNDSCSDGEERGTSPVLGGRRNPRLDGQGEWDFYDIIGTNLKVDSVDIAAVRSKFNTPFPAYDRRPGPAPWATGPPNGGNINAADIALVRAQFNHSCSAAP